MRFRKGQRVEFGAMKMRGVIEIVRPSHLIVYSDGKTNKWWLSRNDTTIKILRTPKTKLNKAIAAYCEAEFKQMGISR